MENNEKSLVLTASLELDKQLSSPAVIRALLATTFKGFKDEKIVRQACLEAMINGYSFQDLIKKKIYAIPFGGGYSLVQSISDVRCKAMRSGQVGKSAPVFTQENGKIETCSVTVKRLVSGNIGEYTATVYFDEYDKGRDNWKTKPRTMIAKVAEMHALRMAFPEELSQAYIEEEFEKEQGNNIDERLNKVYNDSSKLKMGNLIKNNENENNENKNEDDFAESYQVIEQE